MDPNPVDPKTKMEKFMIFINFHQKYPFLRQKQKKSITKHVLRPPKDNKIHYRANACQC